MSDIILKHPALTHSQDMETICRPLNNLGITYFAHVTVTKQGVFSGISNNARFAEHYLRNKYYNADIHLSKKNNLGSYIIWDLIERIGQSKKMHNEASQFGVQHTFTIVERRHLHSHFYHFATNQNDQSINQVYIENIDLLHIFIDYFNKTINSSPILLSAYNIKFQLDQLSPGYTIKENDQFSKNRDKRLAFISAIQHTEKHNVAHFNSMPMPMPTPQQLNCLKLLAEGYSAKTIASTLNLSVRTVENYLARLRTVWKCSNSKELVALFYSSAD